MAIQKEAVRGKERLQQLQEEFPEAGWRAVVKKDIDVHGIRPNEVSRQLGRWALPDAPTYFERNKGHGFNKTEEKSPNGYYLRPFILAFKDGFSTYIAQDPDSPYEYSYEGNGRYFLCRDGEPIEEAYFPPRPQWFDKKTSSGKPMATVLGVSSSDRSLKLAGTSYCGYGKDTCRYCNINTSESVHKETGLPREIAKQEQDLYEATLAAYQEGPVTNWVASGGVLLDPSKEADMYARLIRAMRRAERDAGCKTPVFCLVKCQAMEPEDASKLKEAGVDSVGFNMEVWDPKLWDWICPGKAKYVGRERWLERLLKAQEVFGDDVNCNFVCGVEMAPPHGFKTEDEGAESFLEGVQWMLNHRIDNTPQTWRPAPNTPFEGLTPPRTEYLLRVGLARRKLYQEFKAMLARTGQKPVPWEGQL